MVRYSHVSLVVPCEISEADQITDHLGLQPSRVRESKTQTRQKDHELQETIIRTWMFDSPENENANPTKRLFALADAIEPFSSRLQTLDARYKRWIDIVLHVTPQHPHGITGEFDWFTMPATLMRRLASWNLDVSYEVFWFDHPEWKKPRAQSWWQKLLKPQPK
jgi:hypothetical protein